MSEPSAQFVIPLGPLDVVLLAMSVLTIFVVISKASPSDLNVNPTSLIMEQRGTPSNGHVHFEYRGLSPAVMKKRAQDFVVLVEKRRTLRFFSPRSIPEGVLELCVKAAGTAPSGAHQQPWSFVIVRDPARKLAIRTVVEQEEQKNYDKRMKRDWVEEVEGLVSAVHHGSEVLKPYLTEAPAIVVICSKAWLPGKDNVGKEIRRTVYYPTQGVGIATGMFITALTNVGLVSLTSTPMGAEADILKICNRPPNEKVFLLMPVGFPADDATVPYRTQEELRKPLEEIMTVI